MSLLYSTWKVQFRYYSILESHWSVFNTKVILMSGFSTLGQQLHSWTNYSLQNIHHPFFSGHMQVRHLSKLVHCYWDRKRSSVSPESLHCSLLDFPGMSPLLGPFRLVEDLICVPSRSPRTFTKLEWILYSHGAPMAYQWVEDCGVPAASCLL